MHISLVSPQCFFARIGLESISGILSQTFCITESTWTYFEETAESIEQDSEEQECPSTVKAARIGGKIVEDTSNNQGHNEISYHARQSQTHVTSKSLKSSFHAESNLHRYRNRVW